MKGKNSMIYINCATQQDFVIKTLEADQGEIKYTFKEKKGIKLSFDVNTDNLDEAVKNAKAIVKATPIGTALYFQVTK